MAEANQELPYCVNVDAQTLREESGGDSELTNKCVLEVH